jgi:Glycosyl transferase family 2
MEKPLVICLTPIKDEAWILERFLKCASVWADHIIIADQQSKDESKEIARSFPKVTLIENNSETYNEPERQQLLIGEARKIPGPKILMALDADEFLTANFLTSPEWETILRSTQGTVIRFQRLEVFADTSGLCYLSFSCDPPIGLVDNDTEHKGPAIHSFRIPVKAGAGTVIATQIKIMHYCLLDRERFKSRIRWYQCFEHLSTKKRPIDLYRFYNQDLFAPSSAITPVPKEWLRGYEELGIDMSSIHRRGAYHWDKEVLQLFEKYGAARFKQLGIWDANWTQLHRELYPQESEKTVADPRRLLHRVVHKWLRWTQPDFCPSANRRTGRLLIYRTVQKALALWGW